MKKYILKICIFALFLLSTRFADIAFDTYIGGEYIGTVKGCGVTEEIVNDVTEEIGVRVEPPTFYMKLVLKGEYASREELTFRLKELYEQKHKVSIVATREDPITVEYKEEESLFAWSLKGDISSAFGERWGKMHEGIDIAANLGDNIMAAASGTVTFSGWQQGYGKIIILDNGDGYETCYAHCSELCAEVGQKVEKGDVIALVGNTGVSTGPHLHFEIRKNGEPIDPLQFLKGV